VFLGAGNNGQVPTIEAMEAWYNQAIHPGSNEVHFTVYDLDDLAPIGPLAPTPAPDSARSVAGAAPA
jgi:hypothetical protein